MVNFVSFGTLCVLVLFVVFQSLMFRQILYFDDILHISIVAIWICKCNISVMTHLYF